MADLTGGKEAYDAFLKKGAWDNDEQRSLGLAWQGAQGGNALFGTTAHDTSGVNVGSYDAQGSITPHQSYDAAQQQRNADAAAGRPVVGGGNAAAGGRPVVGGGNAAAGGRPGPAFAALVRAMINARRPQVQPASPGMFGFQQPINRRPYTPYQGGMFGFQQPVNSRPYAPYQGSLYGSPMPAARSTGIPPQLAALLAAIFGGR